MMEIHWTFLFTLVLGGTGATTPHDGRRSQTLSQVQDISNSVFKNRFTRDTDNVTAVIAGSDVIRTSEGTELELKCTINGPQLQANHTIYWQHDSGMMMSSSDDYYIIATSWPTSVLSIYAVKPEDSGTYRCTDMNGHVDSVMVDIIPESYRDHELVHMMVASSKTHLGSAVLILLGCTLLAVVAM